MYDLLNHLTRYLEPQATAALSVRFALPRRQAEQVLPVVASLMLVELRRCLAAPASHRAVLRRLRRYLVVPDVPDLLAPDAEAVLLAHDLLGDRRSLVQRALASVVHVDEEQGVRLTDFLLPAVLAALRREARDGGVFETLASILDPETTQQREQLRRVLQDVAEEIDAVPPTSRSSFLY